MLGRQLAIIGSMTPNERRNPKVLNASRKRASPRAPAPRSQEINRLLKKHRQMGDMMKRMGKQRGGLFGGLFGGGQPSVDMAELERLQGELKNLDPAALPPELRNLPPLDGGLPKTLPGLGAAGGGLLPGLGGRRAPQGRARWSQGPSRLPLQEEMTAMQLEEHRQ